MKVHTVFMSPMRRALETSYHLFKNHPNFDTIKFIIAPKAKEGLRATSDIPGSIDEIEHEFSQKFPNFNLDLLKEYGNRLHYFFEDLDAHIVEELKDKIVSEDGELFKSNLFTVLQEKIVHHFPERFESIFV